MKKKGAILLVILCFLASCTHTNVKPVMKSMPFIASVNLKDHTLTFLNADTLKKSVTWKIDTFATGACLLPDKDHLAIFGKTMDHIQIFSLSQGKLVDKWDTGQGIVFMSILKDRNRIGVIDQHTNTIRILSLNGELLKRQEVGNQPISFLERGGNLYVINFNDQKISILDTKTLKVLDEMPVGRYSTGIMTSKDGKTLWLGGHGEGNKVEEDIHLYSLETKKLVKKLHAPSMPVKFLTIYQSVFIISHGSSTIYKWQTGNQSLQSLKVGINPFEIGKSKDYIVVASYDDDRIYIIEPEPLSIKKVVKTGKGPFQLVIRE
ncbi:hypothetical protein [Bacillus sp. 1P06AnD]|uniref:hypothetical protein n=1 Tax=Bacillus sp. 1P06AnD TaxID=3132208 RepID=UPI0039A0CF09